jgi:membrane protease YdiL (CAAX protease family)
MIASTRSQRPQPALVVAAAGAAGLAFNAARIGVHLDAANPPAAIAAFAVLGLIAIALAGWSRLDQDALGLRQPALVQSPAGGALVLAAMVGPALLTAGRIAPPPLPVLAGGTFLYLFAVAPAEELLFRGVLQGAASRAYGPVAGVCLSAAAFAIAHIPVYGLATLPLAFAAGLMLGWLRWWSRSLAAPAVVHAIADLALLWL